MKKMMIFEPAMCCPTGLCGIGVDSELLRISTALDVLKKQGVNVERFNLSNAPMEFVNRPYVQNILKTKGVNALPLTVIDEEVRIMSRYPSNTEIIDLLGLPQNIFHVKPASFHMNLKKSEPCCSDDCCSAENETKEGCCNDNACCSDGKCC